MTKELLDFILRNIDSIEFKNKFSNENIKIDFVDYSKEKKVKLYYETFHNTTKNIIKGDDTLCKVE